LICSSALLSCFLFFSLSGGDEWRAEEEGKVKTRMRVEGEEPWCANVALLIDKPKASTAACRCRRLLAPSSPPPPLALCQKKPTTLPRCSACSSPSFSSQLCSPHSMSTIQQESRADKTRRQPAKTLSPRISIEPAPPLLADENRRSNCCTGHGSGADELGPARPPRGLRRRSCDLPSDWRDHRKG
jgi:hypothetical protein